MDEVRPRLPAIVRWTSDGNSVVLSVDGHIVRLPEIPQYVEALVNRCMELKEELASGTSIRSKQHD